MKNLLFNSCLLLAIPSLFSACLFLKGKTSTEDYKQFPSKIIKQSAEPFTFPTSLRTFNFPDSIYFKKGKSAFETAFQQSNTYALLVIQNDSILYERYDKDKEARSVVTSFSVAKSFVSALIGIAIDEGYINSIKDPVTDYLSDLNQETFNDLTIEQLLNMESHIKFRENYVTGIQIGKYYHGKNIKKQIPKLKRKISKDGNDSYKSINTQLLGLIIEKATGQSLSQYMQEKLWQPLGAIYDASWSIDSEENQTEKSFCCINARAKDFAKLGCLYLNKGKWNGQQIISKAWVEHSTFPLWQKWKDMRFGGFNGWYHNHWQNFMRITPFENKSLPINESYRLLRDNLQMTNDTNTAKYIAKASNINFAAVGHLGQYIYIVPSKNLVIVRFGENEGGIWWPGFFEDIAALN